MAEMFRYLCFLIWLSSALCETPQIANPPPPATSKIPLYGPSGQPQENDIQQGSTPDCFLEAALAAIVRLDPDTLTGLLLDNSDGTVNVSFYNNQSEMTKITVTKKDFEDRLRTDDSTSGWVAVLQDAYQKLLKAEGLPDNVHNGAGGSPFSVFKVIYGPAKSVSWADCSQMSSVGQRATSSPMTLNTNASSGELVKGHSYTVHSANESHIVLRNPWGVVNENDWGTATNGGADIKSLGNGTFIIPISSASKQCVDLEYVDIVNEATDKTRAIRRSPLRQTRPTVSGLVVIVILSVSLVSMALFCGFYKRKHRGWDGK